MRVQVRVSLVALLVSALVAVLAPAAAQASFGIEKFFAGNCSEEKCGEHAEEPTEKKKKNTATVKLAATCRSA